MKIQQDRLAGYLLPQILVAIRKAQGIAALAPFGFRPGELPEAYAYSSERLPRCWMLYIAYWKYGFSLYLDLVSNIALADIDHHTTAKS